MPTGYAGEGKTYSKLQGKWVTTKKENDYNYDNTDNNDSAAFLVSFFRWYPDYFADVFRDEHAKFKLELPQRIMMRAFARYKNTYITGVRGLTKTYVLILEKMIEGILFPGKKMRYTAPNQKQSAKLASQTFHEIERDYPIIAGMWKLKNDKIDMFQMRTIYGSEFTMYVTRGDTCDECIGEECGQEGDNSFPMEAYTKEIYPSVRGDRMINQEIDPTYIPEKHTHIGNATRRLNPAFTKLRQDCLDDMVTDKNPYEGCILDISWVSALMSNLRSVSYFKRQKKILTPEDWLRECCAQYTGSGENPLISQEILYASRKLKIMETAHCGNPDCIYIVSHDVAYMGGGNNAECGDVILKLTPYTDESKREKYLKQVVYVDSYPPPNTYFEQANIVKRLWERFCLDGGNATYIVVDANSNGDSVVAELMKPGNGVNLCCYNHLLHPNIEQPDALPIIYPIKAGARGTKDPDGMMITYAQSEFRQGNVELLISSVIDGINEYKKLHRIKDGMIDSKIKLPYTKTELLCQQISNLKAEVSGQSYKEKRKSPSIQRDIWSALKYALRMSQILEELMTEEKYRSESKWNEVISNTEYRYKRTCSGGNTRVDRLLSLRKV